MCSKHSYINKQVCLLDETHTIKQKTRNKHKYVATLFIIVVFLFFCTFGREHRTIKLNVCWNGQNRYSVCVHMYVCMYINVGVYVESNFFFSYKQRCFFEFLLIFSSLPICLSYCCAVAMHRASNQIFRGFIKCAVYCVSVRMNPSLTLFTTSFFELSKIAIPYVLLLVRQSLDIIIARILNCIETDVAW